MIKDGGLSLKLNWRLSFYHRITVVENAWKNPCVILSSNKFWVFSCLIDVTVLEEVW